MLGFEPAPSDFPSPALIRNFSGEWRVTWIILSSPFGEREEKQTPSLSVGVYLGGWGDVLE